MNDDKRLIIRFGEEVRAARLLLGWSQVELADHARTSQGCVSRIESGKHTDIHFVNALGVARALGIALAQLDTPLSPVMRALTQVGHELPLPATPPFEPTFAALLQQFHRLSPVRRETFVRIVQPIAALLADPTLREDAA